VLPANYRFIGLSRADKPTSDYLLNATCSTRSLLRH
jgi:hypothetical protein